MSKPIDSVVVGSSVTVAERAGLWLIEIYRALGPDIDVVSEASWTDESVNVSTARLGGVGTAVRHANRFERVLGSEARRKLTMKKSTIALVTVGACILVVACVIAGMLVYLLGIRTIASSAFTSRSPLEEATINEK